jgi:hypothetical protein
MAAERTVDAYVAALPDGQREIAEAVRRLVRSAAPEDVRLGAARDSAAHTGRDRLLPALEAARQLDVPMPTTAVTNELLTAARGMGIARRDFATVFHAPARMAGIDDA